MPMTSFASENEYILARDVQYRMKIYDSQITALDEISNSQKINDEDRAQRDLALCELVGETDGNSGELFRSTANLMRSILDLDDRSFLDNKGVDIIEHNVALKGFCIRSYNGEFRDIPYLKSTIKTIRNDFFDLNPIIKKYLDTKILQ
jgi:hypothetical protein